MPKHYLTELDLTAEETNAILDEAARLKADKTRGADTLTGQHVALYFEKPSVRTRVSFTVGVHQLGGQVVELTAANTKLGQGEEIADFAQVISRYVDIFVGRVFSQAHLELMTESATIPVVNALSDARHPCQALADCLTMREKCGGVAGKKFVYVGDGNNVAASSGLLAAALGAEVYVASPEGYELPQGILTEADGLAGSLAQVRHPSEVIGGADVVYTDTWISMGQEAEAQARRPVFRDYRVTADLMAAAGPQAWAMHCLPAVRGEEIDVDVMYADHSAIWDQAENRLHVQKALLRFLVGAL